RPAIDQPGTRRIGETGVRGESSYGGGADRQLSVRHFLDARTRASHPAHGAQQPGRGQCAGGCPVWRLQPRRTVGDDVADVSGATTTDDGLRPAPRPNLYVFQGQATVPVRVRIELYVVRIFSSEDERAAIGQRWRGDRKRRRAEQRSSGRG